MIQTGFSQTTSDGGDPDNGLHFIANLGQPVPERPNPPPGGAAPAARAPTWARDVILRPEHQESLHASAGNSRYSASLPGNSVLEVSYAGNRGVRQLISRNLDALPDQYLSTSPCARPGDHQLAERASAESVLSLLPGTSLSGTRWRARSCCCRTRSSAGHECEHEPGLLLLPLHANPI